MHNAAAVILAHNNPAGIADPSLADRRLTEQISSALVLIEVKVLNHIVIGHGEFISGLPTKSFYSSLDILA